MISVKSIQRGLVIIFSTFFCSPFAWAAPQIEFSQAPEVEFKVYEQDSYSVLVGLSELKHPTLVHFYIANDEGSEYLIESHTYETAGVYTFNWDGQYNGKALKAGDYELRLKSGGLYEDEKNALIFAFFLTDNFKITIDESPGEGYPEDEQESDIQVTVQSEEPLCAELRVDGNAYQTYEALESGSHELDLDALIDSGELNVGFHEWGIYTNGLACGGSEESEQLVSSGQFEVIDAEPDYASLCGQFTDIEPSHPDCPAIGYVWSIGAMTGYPDGSFRPEKILQRDEVSKISLKAFDLFLDGEDYCQETSPFPDVQLAGDSAAWSAHYVCRGVTLGMITGYKGGEDAGKFIPARLVNIAEFLALILRNLEEPMPSVNNYSYINVPAGQWYSSFFKFAYDNTLLESANTSPTDDVPRLQVAKILYKLHQLGKL